MPDGRILIIDGTDQPSQAASGFDRELGGHQRLLELEFTQPENCDYLCVEAPPNADDCPPGYYVLFILENRTYNSDPIRILSEAVWVKIDAEASTSPCYTP